MMKSQPRDLPRRGSMLAETAVALRLLDQRKCGIRENLPAGQHPADLPADSTVSSGHQRVGRHGGNRTARAAVAPVSPARLARSPAPLRQAWRVERAKAVLTAALLLGRFVESFPVVIVWGVAIWGHTVLTVNRYLQEGSREPLRH